MQANKLFLSLLLYLIPFQCYSSSYLDSFFNKWQDQSLHDSIRVSAFEDYIWEGFMYESPDSAFKLARELQEFCISRGYRIGEATASNTMGSSFFVRGDFAEALRYFTKSLTIMAEVNDVRGLIVAYSNIGLIYKSEGFYIKALNYYKKGLDLANKVGDGRLTAGILNNLGQIYQLKADYKNAKKYYERTLELDVKNASRSGMAGSYANIGSVHADQGENEVALDFYNRSLVIYRELNDRSGEARVMNKLGVVYLKMGLHEKALEYTQRAMAIFKEIDNHLGESICNVDLGYIWLDQDDPDKAIVRCSAALEVLQKVKSPETKRKACQCLYEGYKRKGNTEKALGFLEMRLVLDDSLKDDETRKKLHQIEFEKQILTDSLKLEEEKLRLEMKHASEVHQKDLQRNLLIVIVTGILFIALSLWHRLQYVRKSRSNLRKEKERSDHLLLNILPSEIAEELKEKGKAEARDFELVSILFTDFKEFTQKSEKLTAKELVKEINVCFEAFDKICERYDIEKIKTIGDSYMAAGGLPVPTSDSVHNTVLAGLEMSQFMVDRKKEKLAKGDIPFEMRVGIHTGPVVAGIVGVKKFQYDIWGDTVNTASRMESNGEVEKVNISHHTYEIIKGDPKFAFEPRGKINVKGKGEVEMYFVSLIKG